MSKTNRREVKRDEILDAVLHYVDGNIDNEGKSLGNQTTLPNPCSRLH